MPREKHIAADALLPWLERCGYDRGNILRNLELGNGRKATWTGFSHRPFDNRSSCIVVMDVDKDPYSDTKACRITGAPVTLLCRESELLWWKQGEKEPEEFERIPANQIEGFFRRNKQNLSPETIYRAKTLGPFQTACQMEFVDLGLMPALEKEMGSLIQRLLLDQVAELRGNLRWLGPLSEEKADWLIKAVFWLLGAKMLHDKNVKGFIRLDFSDVENVFARVAKHYGQSDEAIINTAGKLRALRPVAERIAGRADLRLASTEALSHVYETTMISSEVRKNFGTHSTPSYLVDYIVGRLAPWIEEIPRDERNVFEPACGHGGFLVAAVRMLTGLLSAGQADPERRCGYLRERVTGCDKDAFALEIARLSLTLADIPNPNGWNLSCADVFAGDILESASSKCKILLANPPFERFTPDQRIQYESVFKKPGFISKAAEILHRSVSALPDGGVFGLVLPQNLLHSRDAEEFRKMLVETSEFEEICLFPDKVFNFSDSETAILIGRKALVGADRDRTVFCRRVREKNMEIFRKRYEVTSTYRVSINRFRKSKDYDLRVPELHDIWEACAEMPKLAEFAGIGKGFSFIGKENQDYPKGEKRTSSVPLDGFEPGFLNLRKGAMSHTLPEIVFFNMNSQLITGRRSGIATGRPQIICNYSPMRRAPWCVVTMIDPEGHNVSDRFNVVRSKSELWPDKILWAFLNSPFANAFAYTHSSKRHILSGTWRQMPVPGFSEIPRSLLTAVGSYFEEVENRSSSFALSSDEFDEKRQKKLKSLHWRIDAEVLNLYGLDVELERKLLDYFSGIERVGVPFSQDRYFTDGFSAPVTLRDYISITEDWETTNARRIELIRRKVSGKISTDERKELRFLQRLADAKSELVMPLPTV